MSTNKPVPVTTPVGRLVGGSVYEPRTTDYDNKPLVVKTGANAGQPRKDFSFGVAFPKTPGATHWSQEAWLAPVWQMAHAAFPAGEAQRPDFAWKITDGDSTIPNKRGKKPCDNEGYKGHWVIWFSGGTAPRIYNANGSQIITELNAVKPGYFVQVFGNFTDNKPSASPGLYVNHSIVALSAYGEEIVFGPDVSAAGFGNAALPPGASATPPAGMPVPNVPGVPAAPSLAPAFPTVPVPVVPASVPPAKVLTAKAPAGSTYESFIAQGWTEQAMIDQGYLMPSVPAPLVPSGSVPMPSVPAPTVPAPIPVTPNLAFVQVPGAPIPPAPGRVMLDKAGGHSYEAWIAQGWNDAMLVQHGMMAA